MSLDIAAVQRALRDEVNAHALGSNQPYDLLDFFDQRLLTLIE
jgi:hypothetical protein